MYNLCQVVSQGTVGRTVLTLVLTLLMVTDAKGSVTVTRTAVMCLQDVQLLTQVPYNFAKTLFF